MNLILNQSRKEFGFLRRKWLFWLALLLVELAADLQWLDPIQAHHADGYSAPFWMVLLSSSVWLGAVWLALSYGKEDAWVDEDCFIAARPISQRLYWSGRLLVFALLLILPLALQEAGYLWLVGRPVAEVWTGMFARGLLAGAALLWLLPLPLLATGWARFGLVGAAVIAWFIVKVICEKLSETNFRFSDEWFYDDSSLVRAGYLAALGMMLLAWWQRRRGLSGLKRIVAVSSLALACYGLLWTPGLWPWSWRAQHPDLVKEIEARNPTFDAAAKVTFAPRQLPGGQMKVLPYVWFSPLQAPRSWIPYWRVNHLESDSMTPDPRPRYPRSFFLLNCLFSDHHTVHAPFLGLPDGTLTCNPTWNTGGAIDLNFWSLPEDIEATVNLRGELLADWCALEQKAQFPLRKGERAESPDFEAEILDVRAHEDGEGSPRKGAVTLVLTFAYRQASLMEPFGEVKFSLHSADLKLAWQTTGFGGSKMGCFGRAWVPVVGKVVVDQVLTGGTGLTEKDLEKLHVIAFCNRYAGTSNHRVDLQGLPLGDSFQRKTSYLQASNPRVASKPRQGFQQELQRLKKPPLDAPRAEVARYLAHVLTLGETLRRRGGLNLNGQPNHPGDDLAIADELAPFLIAHPDLLTTHLPRPHGHGKDENRLLRDLLEAALLAVLPDDLTRQKDGLQVLGHETEEHIRVPIDALIDGGLDWKEQIPKVEQAIREKQVEPLLALHQAWQDRQRKSYTDQEVLDNLKSKLSLIWAQRMKGREAIIDQGRALILKTYDDIVPATAELLITHKDLAEAAVFCGSERALDQMLRSLRMRIQNDAKMDRLLLQRLSVLSRALGGKVLTGETSKPFIDSLKHLNAAELVYDPNQMIWQARTQP